MSSSKIRIAIIVKVILLALVQYLYDPISSVRHSLEVASIRSQIFEERTRWNAANIQDYDFEIHGESPGICAVDALIEVRGNIVAEVKPNGLSSLLPPEKWADPDWGNEVFLCDYGHFTIARIFDMVEKTLKNAPSSILLAEFDPQYGFITHFKDGIFVPNGWLSPKIGDCCNEFRIENFQQQ